VGLRPSPLLVGLVCGLHVGDDSMSIPILRKDSRPWYDEGKEELNDAARASGFTEAQIEHAHLVARGDVHLDEACQHCGEQALRYQRRIRMEGRCLIQCDNCQASYTDAAEMGGIQEQVGVALRKDLKGIAGRRPQG
jgi:hypothetical protein